MAPWGEGPESPWVPPAPQACPDPPTSGMLPCLGVGREGEQDLGSPGGCLGLVPRPTAPCHPLPRGVLSTRGPRWKTRLNICLETCGAAPRDPPTGSPRPWLPPGVTLGVGVLAGGEGGSCLLWTPPSPPPCDSLPLLINAGLS